MNNNIPAESCQAVDTDPIRFMKAQKLLDSDAVELVSDEGYQRIYTVVAQSDPHKTYKVYRSDHDAICTCFDSVRNHVQCKHIIAVLMIDPIKYEKVDNEWAWQNICLTPDSKEILNWLYAFRDLAKPIPMSTKERIRFTNNRNPIVSEADMAKGKPSFKHGGTIDSDLWYCGYRYDAIAVVGGNWTNTNIRSDCKRMTINVYYDRKAGQWCIMRKRDGFWTSAEYDDIGGLIRFFDDTNKNAMVNCFIKGMKLFIIAMDTYKELFGDYPNRMEFNNLLFHESSVYFHTDANTDKEFAIDVSVSHEDGKSIVIQHTLQKESTLW